jgi:hypothetical protein
MNIAFSVNPFIFSPLTSMQHNQLLEPMNNKCKNGTKINVYWGQCWNNEDQLKMKSCPGTKLSTIPRSGKGSGGIAPHTKLGFRWRRVVGFAPRPRHPCAKTGTPRTEAWMGPKTGFDVVAKTKIRPFRELKTVSPVRGLVTIKTELNRLLEVRSGAL